MEGKRNLSSETQPVASRSCPVCKGWLLRKKREEEDEGQSSIKVTKEGPSAAGKLPAPVQVPAHGYPVIM
jgi:hypothetical protein